MPSFSIELKAKTGLNFVYKPLPLQRFSGTILFYCHIVLLLYYYIVFFIEKIINNKI